MGRIEIEFDAFLEPLRWLLGKSAGRGIVGKGFAIEV